MAVLVYLWKVKYKQMSAIYVSEMLAVSQENVEQLITVFMLHCVNKKSLKINKHGNWHYQFTRKTT